MLLSHWCGKCYHGIHPNPLEQNWNSGLAGEEGTPIQVCGIVQVQLSLKGKPFQLQVVVVEGLTTDVILGLDFLEGNRCTIDLGRRALQYGDTDPSAPMERPSIISTATVRTVGVTLAKTLKVPAYSEMEVMANLEQPNTPGQWVLEGKPCPVMIAHSPDSSASVPLQCTRGRNEASRSSQFGNGSSLEKYGGW